MKAAIVAVAIALFHAGAFGQGYPGKPIRIMVGFSAGSTTDILARTVGQKMSEAWGQPVLVEFDAYIRGEVAKFQKIVKDAGIKPE